MLHYGCQVMVLLKGLTWLTLLCQLLNLAPTAFACDSDLTFEELVREQGFIFEKHQVVSQGYILTLYRIPG